VGEAVLVPFQLVLARLHRTDVLLRVGTLGCSRAPRVTCARAIRGSLFWKKGFGRLHYTYVLLSERDGMFYKGTTGDLRTRLKGHAAGCARSTAHRRPLKLVYYEACLSADDAYRRERYLKSGRGSRYLRARLASSLGAIRGKLERY